MLCFPVVLFPNCESSYPTCRNCWSVCFQENRVGQRYPQLLDMAKVRWYVKWLIHPEFDPWKYTKNTSNKYMKNKKLRDGIELGSQNVIVLESVDGFVMTTRSVEIRGFPKFHIQKSRWQEFVLAVGNGSRRHIDLHVVGAVWNRRLVSRFRIAVVPQVTIQNESTSLRSSRPNNNFRWCMGIWLVRDYFVDRHFMFDFNRSHR